ncbi:hypothetical protein PG994_009048 [Apiospora phragmitis]|uniref:Uncharacterized protein n=1 Tax=Apiospora phragmitis TaxID=2905665 RepID=A0ABR1UI68_9PEZI
MTVNSKVPFVAKTFDAVDSCRVGTIFQSAASSDGLDWDDLLAATVTKKPSPPDFRLIRGRGP